MSDGFGGREEREGEEAKKRMDRQEGSIPIIKIELEGEREKREKKKREKREKREKRD